MFLLWQSKAKGSCLFYCFKEDHSKDPNSATKLTCKFHRTLGERQGFVLGVNYSSIFTNAPGQSMLLLGLKHPHENSLWRTRKSCLKYIAQNQKKKSVSSGSDRPLKQVTWGLQHCSAMVLCLREGGKWEIFHALLNLWLLIHSCLGQVRVLKSKWYSDSRVKFWKRGEWVLWALSTGEPLECPNCRDVFSKSKRTKQLGAANHCDAAFAI